MKRKTKKRLKNLLLSIAALSIFLGASVAFGQEEPANPHTKVIKEADEDELTELEQVLWLECRGESWDGQVATAQVVLNRCLSDEYPDTIHEVLSQVDGGYRQYSTYRNRHLADPGEDQSDLIEFLCNADMSEFPLSIDYVYQATRRQGYDCVKIDNQWFGKR